MRPGSFVNTEEFEVWCHQAVIGPLIRAMQERFVSTDPAQPDPLPATIAAVKEAMWARMVTCYLSGKDARPRSSERPKRRH